MIDFIMDFFYGFSYIIVTATMYIGLTFVGYLIVRLVAYAVFTSYFQVVKLFKKEEKENGKEG